jgi:hypothetical protein
MAILTVATVIYAVGLLALGLAVDLPTYRAGRWVANRRTRLECSRQPTRPRDRVSVRSDRRATARVSESRPLSVQHLSKENVTCTRSSLLRA